MSYFAWVRHREFSRRIQHRHNIFWKDSDAEKIRNTVMKPGDNIFRWKDSIFWQRKLSNKANARLFAQLHGCRVPELYWRGRDLNGQPFPDNFVIRPTIGHSSRSVFVMKEGMNLMDRQNLDRDQIKQAITPSINQNTQLEYLLEEFVQSEDGQYRLPDDCERRVARYGNAGKTQSGRRDGLIIVMQVTRVE